MRPQKHSLTLQGHRTSVSLEPEFWDAFRAIAAKRGIAINALAAEIDEQRVMQSGLASAIRVYVLRYYRDGGQGESPRSGAGISTAEARGGAQ